MIGKVNTGGGGKAASIFAINTLQTDTVYCTKGAKRKVGVWTTIDGVNGFFCNYIREYGTWILTVERAGNILLQNVLIDDTDRVDVEVTT